MTQTSWYGFVLGILLGIAGAFALKYERWDAGLALVGAAVCVLLAGPISLYIHRSINKEP